MLTCPSAALRTWRRLALIGIPSWFILGIQAGPLAFIPTMGALIGGLIVVLATFASVFGIWGLMHTLPLMAIGKVVIY